LPPLVPLTPTEKPLPPPAEGTLCGVARVPSGGAHGVIFCFLAGGASLCIVQVSDLADFQDRDR
jgi:hypothetical protein